MSRTCLVAGGSGSLGRHVIREAVRRGHTVRALVNRSPLPEEFTDVVTKVHRADALIRSELAGACDGVDVVFSSMGASVLPSFGKGRRSYRQVDTPTNRNLIAEAGRAGVERFVYVSVAGTDKFGHLEYVRAHEDVVGALTASGMDWSRAPWACSSVLSIRAYHTSRLSSRPFPRLTWWPRAGAHGSCRMTSPSWRPNE